MYWLFPVLSILLNFIQKLSLQILVVWSSLLSSKGSYLYLCTHPPTVRPLKCSGYRHILLPWPLILFGVWLFVWDRVLFWIPGWPGIHYVTQTVLRLTVTLLSWPSTCWKHWQEPPHLVLLILGFFVCLFFKTGFPCITVLDVLELALIDQAGLELTGIHLLLPPSAGIKGIRHHRPAGSFNF